MNTDKDKSNKALAPKQASDRLERAKMIKPGIDVHVARYVIVRLIDGGTPQPPAASTFSEAGIGTNGWVSWLQCFCWSPFMLCCGAGRCPSPVPFCGRSF